MARPLKTINKGDRYGKLTVLKELPFRDIGGGKRLRHFRFICDCGDSKDADLINVTRGSVKSCGCLYAETNKQLFEKHGLSKHPLYNTWKCMVSRCHNPKDKNYKDYGGRGIFVCKAWRNKDTGLEAFVGWAENKYEKGLELDRQNNTKGYSTNNCHFVSKKLNINNRRTTRFVKYKGKNIALGNFWSEYLEEKVPFYHLAALYNKGLSAKMILEKLNAA